jgi:hypothetical protein
VILLNVLCLKFFLSTFWDFQYHWNFEGE